MPAHLHVGEYAAFRTRRVVYPLTAANVSTLTTLLAWNALGDRYSALLFACVNKSSTETVTLYLDTSEDGVRPDETSENGGHQQILSIGPGMQGSIEVGPDLLRTYFRLSAQTAAPTYNIAAVEWCVKGLARYGS